MKLFIITDIFGQTDALFQLIDDISTRHLDLEIIDPYNQNKMSFRDENEAYHSFAVEIGLDEYTRTVSQRITCDKSQEKMILSFSVGSSAVWVAAENWQAGSIKQCICFYSSQIRNYLQVVPKVNIDLYFAEHEPKYDVSEVITVLAKKNNVHCWATPYLHGFMNRCSKNFHENGYKEYLQLVKKQLS